MNSAWELMGGFLKTEFSCGRSSSGAFCTEQCWPVGQTLIMCLRLPLLRLLSLLVPALSICGPRVDDEFVVILWDGKEEIQKECNKKKYKYRWGPHYLLPFCLHSFKSQYLVTCCDMYLRLEKCWVAYKKGNIHQGTCKHLGRERSNQLETVCYNDCF